MISSPWTWGATLSCALGGAIAGTALGSTPVIDRASTGAVLPSYENSRSAAAAFADTKAPDHYPLVTPRGTVPVAELSQRGLYSQARFQPVRYSAGHYAMDPELADYHIDTFEAPGGMDRQRPDGQGRKAAIPSGEASKPLTKIVVRDTVATQPAAPLRLQAGPIEIPRRVEFGRVASLP